MRARVSRLFYFSVAVLIALIFATTILSFARDRFGGPVGGIAGTVERWAGVGGGGIGAS